MAENLNLFEYLGINVDVDVVGKKSEKKSTKKSEKSSNGKKKETHSGIDVTNGITIKSGFRPSLRLERADLPEDHLSNEAIIAEYAKLYPEYVTNCELIKEKDEYFISFVSKAFLYKGMTIDNKEGDYKIVLGEYTVELDEETLTLEYVISQWEELFPSYKGCKYILDSENKLIIPFIENREISELPETFTLSMPGSPNRQLSLCDLKLHSNEFSEENDSDEDKDSEEDDSDTLDERLRNYIRVEYGLENFSCNVVDEVVNIYPYKKVQTAKKSQKPKETMYPTNYSLSLGYTRIQLNPEMFDGKTEVSRKELQSLLEREDHPEYTGDRTSFEIMKEHNMIIACMTSASKGASIKIEEKYDWMEVDRYGYGKGYINGNRIERTCVGIFDTNDMEFHLLLQKIPREIFKEILSFFLQNAAMSLEAMAIVYYDLASKEYTLVKPEQEVTAVRVKYSTPPIEFEPNMIRVLDIHSHHIMNAFFSAEDDADEKRPQIYGVIGNLDLTDTKKTSIAMRCATGGTYIPVNYREIFEL